MRWMLANADDACLVRGRACKICLHHPDRLKYPRAEARGENAVKGKIRQFHGMKRQP